jgi:hypothetical protein
LSELPESLNLAVIVARHQKTFGVILALAALALAVTMTNLWGLAFQLLAVGWGLLIYGSLLIALLSWLAVTENRRAIVQDIRTHWREISVSVVIALAIGDFFRPDSHVSAAIAGGMLWLFAYPATLWASAQLAPRLAKTGLRFRWWQGLVVIGLLYVAGPEWSREWETKFCDPPRSYEIYDYEERDDGRRMVPVYACFDPGVQDFVPERVEGRNLFALGFTTINVRIFSLDFTNGTFLGFASCDRVACDDR